MQKPFYLILSLSLLLSLTAVKSAGLDTMTVASYDEVYSDRGTGADQDLSVWRPQLPTGWFNLGYIFTNDRNPPSFGTIIVKENTPGMLAEPIGWQFDWNDAGSGGDADGSIWTPLCPAGYHALGSVAIHIQNGNQVTNANFPDIRCVRCGLVEFSSVSGTRWTDSGSGADLDVTVNSIEDSQFFVAGWPEKVYKLSDSVDKPLMKRFEDGQAASVLQFAVGDFNGDGKDDFISQEKGNQWANLFLETANEDKFNKIILPRDYDLNGDNTKIYVGDFNGDGRDDFIRVKEGDWTARVFLAGSDGTEFDYIDLPEAFAMDLAQINLLIGDFNGDGKDDLLRQEKGAFDDDSDYSAQIIISDGDGYFTRIPLSEEYELQERFAHLYVGDFNGDGKTDFLRIETGSDANTGTLFLTSGLNSDNTFSFIQIPFPADFLKLQASNTLYIGDFNGDGQDDFIRQVDAQYLSQVPDQQDTVNIFLSRLTKDMTVTGQEDITTLFQQVSLPENVTGDLQAKNEIAFYVGDFNGDGKDDIIRQPTNLRWDTSIANVFLSSYEDNTEGRPITFKKQPATRLSGDYTPLSIGDFNGDGRSDILKQEKGTWGDKKFSLPTLFLTLNNETDNTVLFEKIYYREELNANLIKDADSVKADLGKKMEYDLMNLASVMGYETILFEDSYDIVKDAGNVVLKEKSGICGGVSIKLANWTFVFGDILWGEALRTQQTLIQTDSGTLDNTQNSQPSQQTAEFSREFTTNVDKYDLNTFTWNIGEEVSTTSEVGAGFASLSTTYEINFSIGESEQTGTVTATGETRTLKSVATTLVPPRTLQKYLVKVFGIQTNFDTSVVQLEAKFSVEFSGPLRADNYYNKVDSSENTDNVVFSLGTSSNPFYKALLDQIQSPQNSRWDWDSLTNDHPDAYDWIRNLTDKSTYSTSQYFTLEAVQGTAVQIEFLPTEN